MFNKLFLCFVIVSTLMFAGCYIKGRVVDRNGTGLAGVTITLSGDASMTTTTDSNGNYKRGSLSNMLAAGGYTVTPSRSGYTFTPASANVTITTGVLGELGEVPLPVPFTSMALT